MISRLLLLNGLCAFSIATYHGAAYGLSALFEWTNRYRPVTVPNYDQLGSLSYYGLIFIRQLDAFAIPGFIFVSAFFVAFSAKGRETVPWFVVRSRLKTLFFPFIIWTAVRFALLLNIPDDIDAILSTYYFIVLVVQFYLLAPILAPIARDYWPLVLGLAALIQFSIEMLFMLGDVGVDSPLLAHMRGYFPLWFFPRHLFWFVLGLAVGFHQQRFTSLLARVRWPLVAATVLLLVCAMVEYELIADLAARKWLGPSFRGISSRLYGLSFILIFIAFDNINLPFSRILSDLGGKSLGIYLANIPVIYVVARFLYDFAPWTLGNQLVYQAILISTGLAIPLVLMRLTKESVMRPAYRYIFG